MCQALCQMLRVQQAVRPRQSLLWGVMVFSLHSAQNRTKYLLDELIKNELMHKSVKYLVTVESYLDVSYIYSNFSWDKDLIQCLI